MAVQLSTPHDNLVRAMRPRSKANEKGLKSCIKKTSTTDLDLPMVRFS